MPDGAVQETRWPRKVHACCAAPRPKADIPRVRFYQRLLQGGAVILRPAWVQVCMPGHMDEMRRSAFHAVRAEQEGERARKTCGALRWGCNPYQEVRPSAALNLCPWGWPFCFFMFFFFLFVLFLARAATVASLHLS